LVTFVSPAKTAEPIEMPFGRRGGWLEWAKGTTYLDWGQNAPRERAILAVVRPSTVLYSEKASWVTAAVYAAKNQS